METKKRWNRIHIATIAALTVLSLASTFLILHFWGEWVDMPSYGGGPVSFHPVWNTEGSRLIRKYELTGSSAWWYLLNLFLLIAEIAAFRMFSFVIRFFGISGAWLFPFDFMLAVTPCRLLGWFFWKKYALDFISFYGRVYDLADLYMYFSVAGLLAFYVRYLFLYYPYYFKCTEGMLPAEKRRWRRRMNHMCCRAVIQPADDWSIAGDDQEDRNYGN